MWTKPWGKLSDRVDPGPAIPWMQQGGTAWEWHERYLLYCDAVYVEREIARLQEIESQARTMQTAIETTSRYVQRLTDMQKTAPRTRKVDSISQHYTGEMHD